MPSCLSVCPFCLSSSLLSMPVSNPPFCMSVRPPFCITVCLSARLPSSLPTLHVPNPTYLPICLPVSLSVCPFSAFLPVCLSCPQLDLSAILSAFLMVICFMFTDLYFELLINRNKTSSPENFKFMRFDCTFFKIYLCPIYA